MAKAKKTEEVIDEVTQDVTEEVTTLDYPIITVDSVVDGNLVQIQGYSSPEAINETSKIIRYNDVNTFFTKI